MKGFRIVLVVAGALVSAAAAHADDGVTKSWDRYTGNSDLGGKISVYGTMERTSSSARAYARLGGYLRFFGGTYEAIRVEGESKIEGSVRSNTAKVVIAGYTVYSKSASYAYTWTWEHAQTIFEKEKTIWLYGVPISLEIKVEGTVYAGLTLGASGNAVKASGTAGSYASVSATAGVNLVQYRAGVRGVVILNDNYLQKNLNANFSGIWGNLTYNTDPLKVELKLVLDKADWEWKGWKKGWVKTWKEVASKTIVTWSDVTYSTVLMSY